MFFLVHLDDLEFPKGTNFNWISRKLKLDFASFDRFPGYGLFLGFHRVRKQDVQSTSFSLIERHFCCVDITIWKLLNQ